MGVNAVLACHVHGVITYMMCGEEFHDLQRWMRDDHAGCFESGSVTIHRDCDDYPDWPEAYPFEERPALAAREQRTE